MPVAIIILNLNHTPVHNVSACKHTCTSIFYTHTMSNWCEDTENGRLLDKIIVIAEWNHWCMAFQLQGRLIYNALYLRNCWFGCFAPPFFSINYTEMAIWIYICAENAVSPDGTKPLPEPNIDLRSAGQLDSWDFRNKRQWNLNGNTIILVQRNAFSNVVWKMAPISSIPQWDLNG